MGNSKIKDPNVDIYFEIDKPFYYAGEMVDGNIYLVVKTNLTYNALYLRLEGKEYCHWQEKFSRRNYHTGEKQTYQNEYVLARFDSGLRLGYYTFPFSFKIPPETPGSYLEKDDNNDIRIYYPLQAYLIDYNRPNKRVDYTYNLTIIEPSKIRQSNLSKEDSANPQECLCWDLGHTQMEVKFSNDAVLSGTPILMSIHIDNKRCKKQINTVDVRLLKHVFVQDNSEDTNDWETTINVMRTKSIPVGGQDTIDVQMSTSSVPCSTAIGTIVANYYTIKVEGLVEGWICCCGHNNPTIEKEIYIQATIKKPELKHVMKLPVGWNPVVAPKMIFTAQTKFDYVHNPKLIAMKRNI